MNRNFLKHSLVVAALFTAAGLASCSKDDEQPAPVVVPNQSFTQGFNTTAEATSQGWIFTNYSDTPVGAKFRVVATSPNGYTPFEGAGFLTSDYEASLANLSRHPDSRISNWIISPVRVFQNGDKISFYARSHGSTGYGASGSYADRVQLRLNTFNTSAQLQATGAVYDPGAVGGFTTPLIDINPLYLTSTAATAFPTTWTKYEATISGLNKPDSGRFAIRYFVELEGGANGDEVAIDKVDYVSVSK